MTTPPNSAARRRQLSDDEPITFPEPASMTRTEILPELDENSDLIADPYGNVFCFVCKVSVPKGTSNILQHLGGKKHETNNRRFANPRYKQATRERYVKAAEEQRKSLPTPPPTTATPSPQGAQAAKSGPQTAEEQPNGSTSQAKDATEKRREKKPAKKVRSAKNQAIAHKHQNVTINKSAYIDSIIMANDEDDSDIDMMREEKDAEPESGSDDEEETANFQQRQRPFTPLNYKPPPGPDLFFESMTPETAPSGASAKIKTVITTSGVAKSDSVADSNPKEIATTTEREESNDFIPLSKSGSADADDEAEAQSGKARLLAQQSMHILKDTSGDALPPWLLNPEAALNILCSKDASIAMHFEILQFSTFVTPTEEELQSRNEMVLTIESIVKRLWPSSTAHVFGSYATGLYLPSSDIDMCIMGTPSGGELNDFKELAQAIRNLPGFARRVHVLSNAKVPLVKIISRKTGMNCDICIGRDNGPKNVAVIKKYLNDFPALRPLVLILKCFLKQRDLNDPFSGGLGSYSIFLLVVSHLQMLKYNFPRQKANLGMVLLSFFQLYGRSFNLCMAGIRVKDDGTYFDKLEKYETQPHETIRFSVEDPNDETNELGKNGFAAMRVRKAFSNAAMTLLSWTRDDQSKAPTPLGSILQYDDDMQLRRSKVVLDMEKKGEKVLRDSITEADPKLSKLARAGSNSRGTDYGDNERSDNVPHHSNKRTFSPRTRDVRERDPRKRRRASSGNDHDGGGHGGPQNMRTESSAARNHAQGLGQRSPVVMSNPNSYANPNLNQNINSGPQGNPTFPNAPMHQSMNPGLGYGARQTFPVQQYQVSTPGYQYVNPQTPLGANGRMPSVPYAVGGYMHQQPMHHMADNGNSFHGNQTYGGPNRRGSGKKSRAQFQRGQFHRGNGSHTGR